MIEENPLHILDACNICRHYPCLGSIEECPFDLVNHHPKIGSL